MSKRNSDWLLSVVLVTAGIISIFVSISDLFGLNNVLIPAGKDVSSITLGLLGLVATVLAVERVIQFSQFEKSFNSLELLVRRSSGGQQLKGYREIYQTGERLVSSARSHIRAIVFSSGPKAPDYFIKAMIARMKQQKQAGHLISYQVILATNLKSVPANFQEAIDARNSVYKKAGVDDLLTLYLLDVSQPIEFDVLIIDDEHIVIGFPTQPGIPDVQSGVSFENQAQLGREFVNWYDQRVLPGAIKYNDWLSQNKVKPQ